MVSLYLLPMKANQLILKSKNDWEKALISSTVWFHQRYLIWAQNGKISDNSCRLTLSSQFYINTPFNWYASIWAKYLMNDILESELNLIAIRATK